MPLEFVVRIKGVVFFLEQFLARNSKVVIAVVTILLPKRLFHIFLRCTEFLARRQPFLWRQSWVRVPDPKIWLYNCAWRDLKINPDLELHSCYLFIQLFPSHNHFSHLKFQPSAGRSHKSITGIHKPLILFFKDFFFMWAIKKSLYWVSYDIACVSFRSFGLESCEILVPQSGIHTPCIGRRNLNTWTTSKDSQAFKTPLLENSDSPGAHSSFPWNLAHSMGNRNRQWVRAWEALLEDPRTI